MLCIHTVVAQVERKRVYKAVSSFASSFSYTRTMSLRYVKKLP